MQSNRWFQALIVLLVIIASFYLLGAVWSFLVQFTNIILLFFLSWLLAFVLRPTARWLTTNGFPYTLSVLVVYLVLALLFVIGGIALVPVVTQQVAQLTVNFNSYINSLAHFVDEGQRTLISWGVRDVDINKFYSDLAGQVQSVGMGVLQNTFSVLQSVANLAFQLILVLLLSFYFMKDGDRIFGNVLQMLPPRWQEEARLIAMSIEKSFGSFVRGQLVFALVYAALTAGIMMFFGLDYVVIASVVAGVCMLIPLIGNFLAYIPPMLVVLVTKPEIWFPVAVVLLIVQGIQMQIIGPRIMSSAIGMHPLYVVGAMLIGAQVAGVWGALFGIPVAGAVNLIGRPLMRRIRYQVPLYREERGLHLTTRQFATGPLAASTVEEGAPGDGEIVVKEEGDAVRSPYADYVEEDYPQLRPTLSARAWRHIRGYLSRTMSRVNSRSHPRSEG